MGEGPELLLRRCNFWACLSRIIKKTYPGRYRPLPIPPFSGMLGNARDVSPLIVDTRIAGAFIPLILNAIA